jgi:hypothetical protein
MLGCLLTGVVNSNAIKMSKKDKEEEEMEEEEEEEEEKEGRRRRTKSWRRWWWWRRRKKKSHFWDFSQPLHGAVLRVGRCLCLFLLHILLPSLKLLAINPASGYFLPSTSL